MPRPDTPLINWNHPISKLLVWAALPGRRFPQELVSKGNPTLLPTGGWKDTILGNATSSADTTNGGIKYPWANTLNPITNVVTIAVWCQITGALTSFSHFLCVPNHTTWTNPFSCFTLTTSDGLKMTYQISVGASVFNTSTASNYLSNDNTMRLYAVTVNGSVARFFIDGIFKEQVTLANTGSINLGDHVEVTLGNHNSADRGEGITGNFAEALIWKRALQDDEIRRLYTDPWLLLKK